MVNAVFLFDVRSRQSFILFFKKVFPLKEYLKAQNYDTATSIRDFLPDNCLLTLEDDDNDTLDSVTDVNTAYYSTTNSYPLYDLENVERVTVIQTTMIPTGRNLQLNFEKREDMAYF